MLRLEYFLVAESASVDQLTNKISIFEVFEQVSSATFPTPIYHAVAVTCWYGEDVDLNNDFQSKLVVQLPNGTKLPDFSSNFKLKSKRHRTLQRFEGILLDQPGELLFQMFLDGTHMADHIVSVKKI